jgi:pimeloyl-ACP methyl ester carboxylesterase
MTSDPPFGAAEPFAGGGDLLVLGVTCEAASVGDWSRATLDATQREILGAGTMRTWRWPPRSGHFGSRVAGYVGALLPGEYVDRAVVDGITLEYEDSGTGQPVVCIHGGFIADSFRPLLSELGRANRYRLISYHRRGYVGSGPLIGTVGLADETHDCRALLSHLGVRCAHVIGHSFGGVIALQLALEAPKLVHTLTLLEAALMVGDSEQLYRQGMQQGMQRYREAGPRVVADEFLQMRWPGYWEPLEKALPGAFEQAVADAATSFAADVPAAIDSHFGEQQAREITKPVLVPAIAVTRWPMIQYGVAAAG